MRRQALQAGRAKSKIVELQDTLLSDFISEIIGYHLRFYDVNDIWPTTSQIKVRVHIMFHDWRDVGIKKALSSVGRAFRRWKQSVCLDFIPQLV
jgi:hypothetical protein